MYRIWFTIVILCFYASVLQTEGKHIISEEKIAVENIQRTAGGSRVNGNFNISGHMYHINDEVEGLSWEEAEVYCSNLSMQLVSIQSKQENDDVMNFFFQNGISSPLWSCGVYRNATESWEWSATGEAFTYTGWHITQPNEVWRPAVAVYLNFMGPWWADAGTDQLLGVMCE